MQHFGWLETFLHQRFPEHHLTIRNLGFSGDELTVRLRSMDFGTPDQWLAGSAPVPQPGKLNPDAPVRKNRFELTETKADVIFAFFGFNESFQGDKGLNTFKKELTDFVKHTLSQQYNGHDAPRLDARGVDAPRQPRRLAFGHGPLPEGSELELRDGPLEDELRTLASEGVQSLLLEGRPKVRRGCAFRAPAGLLALPARAALRPIDRSKLLSPEKQKARAILPRG